LTNRKVLCYTLTHTTPTQPRKCEMFELAAGNLQQEQREREIADGLRRRQLLATAAESGGTNATETPASATRQATGQATRSPRIGARPSATAQR
jgi:hypothetical protein